MSLVVMSPEFSAAPTGVLLSGGNVDVDGKSAFTNVLTFTSTKKQQVPSGFSVNWYVPRSRTMVRAVFTLGASRVCQSGLAFGYSARATASANWVGTGLLV